MCLIHDMYQSAITAESSYRTAATSRHGGSRHGAPRHGMGGDLSALLEQVAQVSTRPRYAFMLLTLIAEVAGPDGSAGPSVRQGQGLVTLRDWLCDALTPMGHRDPRRQALAERVRAEMARSGKLPTDPEGAAAVVEAELRERVRASGKTNLSRAVSELVGAGLLRRHYQGYAVDHHNRGAQRQAVYTLIGLSRTLISRTPIAGGQGEGMEQAMQPVPAPPEPMIQAPPKPAGKPAPRWHRASGHREPGQGELGQGQSGQGEFAFIA